MFEATNSYRTILDYEYIERLKKLRDTTKPTATNIKRLQDRLTRINLYIDKNGNPPSVSERKARSNWIKAFIADDEHNGFTKVKPDTIRGNLKSLGL